MKVIPPITLTDAMLTSSNVAEPAASGEAAYNAGTTYALGDVVSVISSNFHHRYESLQAANVGHDPTAAASATWWLDLGPTNRWAMFDTLNNTVTTRASPLTVVLTPGARVDSIAIMGANAHTITVSVSSATGGGVVYSKTTSMINRNSTGWYRYFFSSITTRQNLALFDLPPYSDAVITVTLTRSSGIVTCAAVVLGTAYYIGDVQYNASSDVLNFSSVTRDTSGTATMVQRRNVPKTRQELLLSKSLVNTARTVRELGNATPMVWCALEDAPTHDYFDALFSLGFYRNFVIDISLPDMAHISLELEEL